MRLICPIGRINGPLGSIFSLSTTAWKKTGLQAAVSRYTIEKRMRKSKDQEENEEEEEEEEEEKEEG